MADPPAAPPAGAAMSGQDALLATKLYVPRPQPGFVPRPRLVQALSEGLARGRVLVCAPVEQVAGIDHPFIHEYFLGARGRRALQALPAERRALLPRMTPGITPGIEDGK